MGRNNQQSWHKQSGSRYWSGAWGRGWQKDKQSRNEEPSSASTILVSYTDAKVSAENDAAGEQAVAEKKMVSEGGDQLRQLQKWINATRKAESKARKLAAEVSLRRRKWQKFEQDLKTAYSREKVKFDADILKLQHDLDEAEKQATEASEVLKSFTGSGLFPMAVDQEDANKPADATTDAAWRALVENPENEAEDEDIDVARMQEYLNKALAAAKADAERARQKLRATEMQKDKETAAVGSQEQGGASTLQRASYTSSSPISVDPYMSSPVIHKPPVAEARPALRQRQPGAREVPRVPVKQIGKQHNVVGSPGAIGPSLSQKLDKRRHNLAASTVEPTSGVSAVPASRGPESVLIDDDPDLEGINFGVME